ncbi:MAG: universal stress protein [Desulfohalobiaceae bacterium]|nr:universal stress protein [Desulfohalobiaceae bacterium]
MKILVAYNERARSSKEALQVAKTHAKAYQAQILVATSADPSRSEKDLMSKDEAERVLADIQQELEDEGFACSTHLLILGYSRAEDLLHFPRQKDVDEIVVGVEKRSKVGKFFLGSLAQHVILKADCPVVAVKSPEEEEPDIYLGSTSMES